MKGTGKGSIDGKSSRSSNTGFGTVLNFAQFEDPSLELIPPLVKNRSTCESNGLLVVSPFHSSES